MTKSELISKLSEQCQHLTRKDADLGVTAILSAMTDSLLRGRRIEIRGFGTFSISRRSARMGRNPRSGENVAIPEKHVVLFKTGKELRHRISAPK